MPSIAERKNKRVLDYYVYTRHTGNAITQKRQYKQSNWIGD